MLRLFNSLGREIEDFKPIAAPEVKIYTCGPTVYDYQHVGNYSGYIYWDVLVRLLKASGYNVKRVMNITDVGHLVSDADEGEDKLEKGAHREGKTARQVADFYTEDFKKNVKKLNLLEPDVYAQATDYIPEQLKIIEQLVDKGFAYKTEQAIYFDVSKLADYGKLTGQKLSEKEVGARADVVTDSAKHHPQDFALWFFTVGRFADHKMHWQSPWGEGFPGWHIECSAIIHSVLGDPIDIHTGGVDHIGTHHTNEIAQTEAAFGHELANFWLHNNHMMVDGQKISKSLGNSITLDDLEKRDFSAMDFKMLVLQSHYRSQSNFTWEGLEAASTRLKNVYAWADLVHQHGVVKQVMSASAQDYMAALEDDLRTSDLLMLIELNMDKAPKQDLLEKAELLLGLSLNNRPDINESSKELIKQREEARKNQDWHKSDELRDELTKDGIGLRDTDNGTIWYRL